MTNRNRPNTLTQNVSGLDRPGDAPMSRPAALRSLGKVIYAVELSDGTIKIGCTTNLLNRLYWYSQFEGEVELVAFKPGGFDEELDIHERLKGHRAKRREYYHPNAEVIAVVNEMRTALGMNALAA
jgi:hypothetical protein